MLELHTAHSLDLAAAQGARDHPAGSSTVFPAVHAIQTGIRRCRANARHGGAFTTGFPSTTLQFPAIQFCYDIVHDFTASGKKVSSEAFYFLGFSWGVAGAIDGNFCFSRHRSIPRRVTEKPKAEGSSSCFTRVMNSQRQQLCNFCA